MRRGQRKVLWTQQTAGLGNFLYDWMHAHHWRARDLDIVSLRTPKMRPWLPVFGAPAMELTVEPEDVRRTDRIEKGLYSEWGVAFDESNLDEFIRGFIEPTGVIAPERVPESHRLTDADVLINVRRGDYVSSAANRLNYSFDLDEYLTAALTRSREGGGAIERIHVVSDGIDWCVDHLGWLDQHADRLTFETDGLPPETHLAIVANAPRLILANSTFSYWGGYLSSWRTGRPEWIVAPWFHIRDEADGAAWQLDPRWSIVQDLPSNWAPVTDGVAE